VFAYGQSVCCAESNVKIRTLSSTDFVFSIVLQHYFTD